MNRNKKECNKDFDFKQQQLNFIHIARVLTTYPFLTHLKQTDKSGEYIYFNRTTWTRRDVSI